MCMYKYSVILFTDDYRRLQTSLLLASPEFSGVMRRILVSRYATVYAQRCVLCDSSASFIKVDTVH